MGIRPDTVEKPSIGTSFAVVVAAFVILAVLPGCGSSRNTAATSTSAANEPGHAPEGVAFYTPPSPLPSGQHGDVIWSRPISGTPGLPSAGTNYLILYHSTSVDGRDIAVSGIVAIPRGDPPASGWPVVSWGHGATGVADSCAPSRDTSPDYPEHSYTTLMDQSLDQWVNRGYVVAYSDYEGLGTPGTNPYMVGQSEARSMADIVLAARQLDANVGTRWAAIGHSIGGQAALFSGALAPQWTPQLSLVGVAALSPASHRSLVVPALKSGSTAPMIFTDFPSLLAGAESTNPALPAPEQLLTPTALDAFHIIDSTCATGIDDRWKTLATNQILQDGVDTAALDKALQATEPGPLHVSVPLLVTESSAIPNLGLTNDVVNALCANGAIVNYLTYPGLTHNEVIAASLADTEQWVDARFADQPAPNTCKAN